MRFEALQLDEDTADRYSQQAHDHYGRQELYQAETLLAASEPSLHCCAFTHWVTLMDSPVSWYWTVTVIIWICVGSSDST